jgi:hypothetical protein
MTRTGIFSRNREIVLTPKGREVLRGDEDRVPGSGAFTSATGTPGAGTGPRKP